MNKSLNSIKRRLERLELEHLRQHALELHERIERIQSELERAESDAVSASYSADMWQSHAMELQEASANDLHSTARCIGLTKEGELLVVRNN
jgi:cyclopropane fatty-acyl-phospholipid synthase-like methyltransferase